MNQFRSYYFAIFLLVTLIGLPPVLADQAIMGGGNSPVTVFIEELTYRGKNFLNPDECMDVTIVVAAAISSREVEASLTVYWQAKSVVWKQSSDGGWFVPGPGYFARTADSGLATLTPNSGTVTLLSGTSDFSTARLCNKAPQGTPYDIVMQHTWSTPSDEYVELYGEPSLATSFQNVCSNALSLRGCNSI